MGVPMRTPEDVRTALRTRYRRSVVSWLALPPPQSGTGVGVRVSLPLDPPTARVARDDATAVAAWIRSWTRATAGSLPWSVTWEERRWAGFGIQALPVRVGVEGPAAVARLAGQDTDWRLLSARIEELVRRWVPDAEESDGAGAGRGGPVSPRTGAGAGTGTGSEAGVGTGGGDGIGPAPRQVLAHAVGSCLADLRACEDADFDRSLRVVDWVVTHPGSGLLLRQVPVEGMDTKWLERHRRLVSVLVAALRRLRDLEGGDDLGLRREAEARDVVVLDPQLRPGRGPGPGLPGLRHVRLDVTELAHLWAVPAAPVAAGPGPGPSAPGPHAQDAPRPEVLLVCENRQSIVALPDLPGVVALHGGGYAVSELHHLAWARDLPVLYWGDLDVDGFAILNRLRHHHPRVVSVLMDVATLDEHLGLAVPDPNTGGIELGALTEGEWLALARLRELGGLRLEQERLAWPWVARRLGDALADLRNPTTED